MQLLAISAVCTTGGCSSGPDMIAPNFDGATIFQSVQLNEHAVNVDLAGANSFTFVATPISGAGAPLASSAVPMFRSGDSAIVKIASDGTVTGVASEQSVFIYAQLTIDGVTLVDSAQVYVGNGDGAATQFAIQYTNPADTLVKLALASLTTTIDGSRVPYDRNAAVYYWTRDPNVATFYSSFEGQIVPGAPGKTMVYARTVIGGVTWIDSLPLHVTIGASANVVLKSKKVLGGGIEYSFSPATIYIAVGGDVSWAGSLLVPYSVEFDDPTKADSVPYAPWGDNVNGNISAWQAVFGNFTSFYRKRAFPHVGTVTYHSPELNISGQIVVTSSDDCRPFCAP